MKQLIILLFIISTNLIMAQTPTQPKPLFAQNHIYIPLHETDSTEMHLVSVKLWGKETSLFPPEEPDMLEQEKAFAIKYRVRERSISESYITDTDNDVTAVFFKSDSGTYKIMASSFLANMWSKENSPKMKKGDIGIDIAMQQWSISAVPSPYTLVGYSTDTTLIAVKVWNYIKEHVNNEVVMEMIK